MNTQSQSLKMNRVVCIAGPTASGKSAWALSLAKKYDGEIINADAMQVYKDLRIISARPDVSDMHGIPHHLYGYIDGSVRYSTGQWLRDVIPLIIEILGRGRVPILVGGTGLYFKALTQGLADIPEPGEVARQQAQQIHDVEGIEALRAKATGLDPVATRRVLGHDPQRLLRIVSVALGTGQRLSLWQQKTRPAIPQQYWVGAILLPDRDRLYRRINNRFTAMVEGGGLDEVKALYQRELAVDLPIMKAIGVSQFADYLNGESKQVQTDTQEQATALAQRDTRRFAKRQFTWFRGQMLAHDETWVSVLSKQDEIEFVKKVSKVSI